MCHNVRALENAGHDLVVVARGTVRPPGYAATGNGNGISVNGGIFTLVTPKPDRDQPGLGDEAGLGSPSPAGLTMRDPWHGARGLLSGRE
jgi:hypothetical protein